ncbi:MAG TPA: Fe-S-containing hydro-lyase [Acidobacteriota bacterium]|nr:Fe-S-containing hydro-lyase [Acidobacteriota bacterium]
MAEIRLTAPLKDEDIDKLQIGDTVLISGVIYTGRDAAHKKMVEALDRGEELPFPVDGSVMYYAGPAPTPPGKPIGSVGPTTSYRMDPYAPRLLDIGQKMMIGKGKRGPEVIDACVRNKAVYCAAVGGAAALLAKRVVKAEVIAYDELGPEAIRRLEVDEFPVIVVNDAKGNDLYAEGRKKYEKK